MIAPSQLSAPSATIAADTAADVDWQAVVVGAGPAGAATAWRLAAQGVRTLLIDRHAFPRAKVCGCCLSSRAVRELELLAPDALPAAAVRLDAVRLAHRGRWARISLPAGRVVSRDLLDGHLVGHAISAGCHWLPGVHVSAVADDAHEQTARVTCSGDAATTGRGPHALRAGFVILAAGLADHVRITNGSANGAEPARHIASASRIGVGGVLPADACDLPDGELVMAVGRAGYCGLVRLEDGRIDVAAAFDRAAIARSTAPAQAIAALLADAGASACPLPHTDAVLAAAFRVTPPLTRHAPLVAGAARRILRVGDAAGYVEPFTGEGIGWAMTAARILAGALVAPLGLRSPAEAAHHYHAAHTRMFGRLHARCSLVAAGLRRPAVVAAAITAARALPLAARMVAPVVIGSESRRASA